MASTSEDSIRPSEAQDDARSARPSVTAVVVANRPGDWFEETVESILVQSYSRLDLVVVDSAGEDQLAERLAAVAPDASIISAPDAKGFSAAANCVLDAGLSSAYLLVCHDDVALAPDAVEELVTEALRSNAAVVGPKLVDWEDPGSLQHVGLAVDQFAYAGDLVEPGERDQEQYDAVTDVFAVPSACVLVRAGLFQSLGGFDPGMRRRGEAVDFCWRAQLAGARVLVAPEAVVRHREDMPARLGVDDERRTRVRHELRTVLVTGSMSGLARTLPVMLLLSIGEILTALVTGRLAKARDVFTAWTWNLARLGQIRRRRRALRPHMKVSPSEIRSGQAGGSIRVSGFIAGQTGRGDGDAPTRYGDAPTTSSQLGMLAWFGFLVFVVFGSRGLISSGVPAIGDFGSFGESADAMLSQWWSGWRSRDLGSTGSTPAGVGLLGALAWILGGSIGLARLLWILGPLVIGAVGAWRLFAPTGSRPAQAVTLLAYAALPLPWVALAEASWAGLAAYAVLPFALRSMLELLVVPPYRRADGKTRSWLGSGVSLGVAFGLVAIFDVTVPLSSAVVIVGLVLGSLVVVSLSGLLRLVLGSLVAGCVVAVLALPFTVELVTNVATWHPFSDGRSSTATTSSLADLVLFGVGTDRPSPFFWAFGLPVALPLLIAKGWRFKVAVRLWFVALSSWGLALASAHGVVPVALPDPLVVLAPAALALAGLCGLCVLSLQRDFDGQSFALARLATPAVVLSALVLMVPTVARLQDGRWTVPRAGYASVVPFADPLLEGGSYRVLWVGHPDFLPAQGHDLGDGTAWVATLDGLPELAERTVPVDRGAADEIDAALATLNDESSARVGRLLGGLGVRYVVTVERLAPAPFRTEEQVRAVPADLVEALDTQLDLRRLSGVNSALRVYENTEWVSVRAAAVAGFDDGRDALADLAAEPLTGTFGILAGASDRVEGDVPDGTEILVAQTSDPNWRLLVDGSEVSRRSALGYATVFVPPSGGEAILEYQTPATAQYLLIAQAFFLAAAIGSQLRRLIGGRR